VSVDEIRQADAADYDVIAAVVSEWWGRDVLTSLPRLFLNHFHTTSLIAENDGVMVGFLIGFYSPSKSGEAYIHFVVVDPTHRHGGLARRLYAKFLDEAARTGVRIVRAITSPGNDGSITFHRRMGFEVSGPDTEYNGPGRDMVTLTLRLAE
jgi:L-amino acid N-acyltransferase YncA